jgi:beta-glucosidase
MVYSPNQKQQQRFLWGVSTSSYQVEGGIKNNDWHYFTTSKGIKQRLYAMTKPNIFYRGTTPVILKPAGNAVKTWDPIYYSKDFDLARQMGLNSFRISLEWSRIESERGQWNQEVVNQYKIMIKNMQDRGLKPIITLNHLTLPLWVLTPPSKFVKKLGQALLPSPFKDIPIADPMSSDPFWKSLRGWENYQTVKEFTRFVGNIVQELKSQVDFWITIGEPVASIIGLGYIAGIWPPGFLLDGNRAKRVLHNLIEAHILAYDKIKELDDVDADGDGITNLTGFAHAMVEVNPSKPLLKVTLTDNTEAAKNFAYFVNDYYINAVVNGEEDLNYLKTLERHNKESNDFLIHENWKNKSDFIGVNYYRRVYVYHSNIVALSSARFVGGAVINDLYTKDSHSHQQSHGILNDLGWEIYPQGLYNLILHIKNEWNGIPVIVTENGVADKSDKYRAPFIVSHLGQIKQAIDNGANIIGYLHWSFMDNYEWLDHYKPEAKFGLFFIDHNDDDNDVNLNRKVTKGAETYKFIIEESLNENEKGVVSNSAILKAELRYGKFSPDGYRLSAPKEFD